MNRFTADYSSSINSTPAKDSLPPRKHVSSDAPQLASTTPLVPPPSTIFGSSRLGSGVSTLQFPKESTTSSVPPTPPTHRQPFSFTKVQSSTARSRPFHIPFDSSAVGAYDDEEEEEEQEPVDESMEEGEEDMSARQSRSTHNINRSQPTMPSLLKFSTTSSKISPPANSLSKPSRSTQPSRLPWKGKPGIIPNFARDLGKRAKPAPLEESDETILETEQILQHLQEEIEPVDNDDTFQNIITSHVHELIVQWRRYSEAEPPSIDGPNIGPPPSAKSFTKANYLASLLLALHHPPTSFDGLRTTTVGLPQILLDWLDNYHVSYGPLYRMVVSTSPNVTSHDLFWDAVQSLTLRGKIAQVAKLLADADFKYAVSALDDGEEEPGYHGVQLQTIQSVIYRARQVLNACPASHSANWDMSSSDWDLFRRQVETELRNLTDLVIENEEEEEFQAENFGLRRTNLNLLGRSGQRSRGNLPWTIYSGLKIVYSILMGSSEEIIAQSQDWLEASSALTIWWDCTEDTKVAQWSFDVSRANDQDQSSLSSPNPYLTRLRESFLCVTDPDDKNSFPINALSPIEVGLGSVLQDDMEGSLLILRALSQCVASSTAEIGSLAGWIRSDVSSAMSDLSQADLMVLNYGSSRTSITKDDILLEYANDLFERGILHSTDGSTFEGWELSISILTRLHDVNLIRTSIGKLLDQLQVTEQIRAEKLINLCSDLGLQEEAQKVSERFGDYLVNNTTDYGTALLCYARGHANDKVQQLIDLLVSYCLVQSKAYPDEKDMDKSLRALVGNPKKAFLDIAEVDPDAAATLQFYMVGYACLRKFYLLRDDAILATRTNQNPGLRPIARRRAAAKALIAVMNSAADSIYGGLYDPVRKSAIQVDALLSLLGEATALLAGNDQKRVYTKDEMYAIIAAVDDLQTVNVRVYQAAEECLQASLRNYHGSLPPSPHAMLKKSMSSGTNSNFSFSMMGSEMLAKSSESMGGKSEGSTVLVAGPGKGDNPRGWDWRARFKSADATANDVLKCLRMGIARELSLADLEDSV